MSTLWVSHCSDSTGQMVALDKVFQIRTFKQYKDGKVQYRIVFETTTPSSSQIIWDYVHKDTALASIKRIAAVANPTASEPRTTQLYADLARGFE